MYNQLHYKSFATNMYGLCPVNFKEVFTVRTLQFTINPGLTVSQFINNMKPILATQFEINEELIEIIEAAQNSFTGQAESAPELIPSDSKLYELWGIGLQNVAFYVRRKHFQYPNFENQNQTHNARYNGDCPICLDYCGLYRRYNCTHGVCLGCYNRCLARNFTVCSLCRTS